MENVVLDPQFWAGKRVLLTGHTGFKGGWLTLWLRSLGVDYAQGYAVAKPQPFNCDCELQHDFRRVCAAPGQARNDAAPAPPATSRNADAETPPA